MEFPPKKITLKDGRTAVLRSPQISDAQALVEYLVKTAGETDYVLAYPEERQMPVEREEEFLRQITASPNDLMILAEVDGEIAGNCHIYFNSKIKTAHRASVAIANLKKYWGLGIGTAMFHEMIAEAERRGIFQIELGYVEGNERARALYEKMGFVETGKLPNAFRMKDGTMHTEVHMVRTI